MIKVTRRSTTKLNALMTIWTSGLTTMKTATGSRKILPMSRIMREASYGHAAIGEAMQQVVRCASMMSGSNGQALNGRKLLACVVVKLAGFDRVGAFIFYIYAVCM